jgi:two-component system response regulator FlrC
MPWNSEAALSLLKDHGWPGNVRELQNVVRRALLLADGKPEVGPEHVVFDGTARLVSADMPAPMAVPEGTSGKRLSNIVQLSEARAIMATLEACGGSRIAAARQLGISERTLRYRLASFREAGIAVAGGRR